MKKNKSYTGLIFAIVGILTALIIMGVRMSGDDEEIVTEADPTVENVEINSNLDTVNKQYVGLLQFLAHPS